MNNDLIQKYLAGQCTPEEEQEVISHLDAHMISVENTVNSDVPADVSESLLQDIHAGIRARQRTGVVKQLKRWSVAAAVIIMAGTAVYLMKPSKPTVAAEKWTAFHNEGQEVKKINMPDGTTIWLNARASLSYNEQTYNDQAREVSITGEAYFDVAADPQKPFRVKAGSVTTVVLGTAFNVEHYGQENNIRVTLVQGKVEVAADNDKHILTPGQQMTYHTDRHKMEVHGTDISSTKAWLSGKLVFNDLPLEDVLKRIGNMYQISIVCPQPAVLEGKRLSGTYTRKEPAALLEKILFVHGLKLEQRSGQFIIKP